MIILLKTVQHVVDEDGKLIFNENNFCLGKLCHSSNFDSEKDCESGY